MKKIHFLNRLFVTTVIVLCVFGFDVKAFETVKNEHLGGIASEQFPTIHFQDDFALVHSSSGLFQMNFDKIEWHDLTPSLLDKASRIYDVTSDGNGKIYVLGLKNGINSIISSTDFEMWTVEQELTEFEDVQEFEVLDNQHFYLVGNRNDNSLVTSIFYSNDMVDWELLDYDVNYDRNKIYQITNQIAGFRGALSGSNTFNQDLKIIAPLQNTHLLRSPSSVSKMDGNNVSVFLNGKSNTGYYVNLDESDFTYKIVKVDSINAFNSGSSPQGTFIEGDMLALTNDLPERYVVRSVYNDGSENVLAMIDDNTHPERYRLLLSMNNGETWRFIENHPFYVNDHLLYDGTTKRVHYADFRFKTIGEDSILIFNNVFLGTKGCNYTLNTYLFTPSNNEFAAVSSSHLGAYDALSTCEVEHTIAIINHNQEVIFTNRELNEFTSNSPISSLKILRRQLYESNNRLFCKTIEIDSSLDISEFNFSANSWESLLLPEDSLFSSELIPLATNNGVLLFREAREPVYYFKEDINLGFEEIVNYRERFGHPVDADQDFIINRKPTSFNFLDTRLFEDRVVVNLNRNPKCRDMSFAEANIDNESLLIYSLFGDDFCYADGLDAASNLITHLSFFIPNNKNEHPVEGCNDRSLERNCRTASISSNNTGKHPQLLIEDGKILTPSIFNLDNHTKQFIFKDISDIRNKEIKWERGIELPEFLAPNSSDGFVSEDFTKPILDSDLSYVMPTSTRGLMRFQKDLTLGINYWEVAPQPLIEVYPNPTQEFLRIDDFRLMFRQFSIIDLEGKERLKGIYVGNPIDVKSLPQSNYLLVFEGYEAVSFIKN